MRTLKFIVYGIAGVVLGTLAKKLGMTLQHIDTSAVQRDDPIVLIECEPSDIGWLGNSPELTRFVRETLGRRLPDEDDKLGWN